MKKYWTTISALFMVLAIVVAYREDLQTLPIALKIMMWFVGFVFVVAMYVIDVQERRIKAQQDYIDLALWAGVKAVYANGRRKGFGRNNVGDKVSE